MFRFLKKEGGVTEFREVIFNSGNGLLMPRVPTLTSEEKETLQRDASIANSLATLLSLFVRDVPFGELLEISKKVSFPLPTVKLTGNIYALELFHGPTGAFKDVGATILANLMDYYLRDGGSHEVVNLVVATSGDTGSAVANAFFGKPQIKVTIMYPKGGVTPLQEAQICCLGDNIKAIELNSDFDMCQALMKQFLDDPDIPNVASANSINLGRLLPQMIYYLQSLKDLQAQGLSIFEGKEKVLFSVPSGNLGNLTAGVLLAQILGLENVDFICANNLNNAAYRYFAGGRYEPRPTIPTISNAMDVGNPNNFPRLIELGSPSVRAYTTDDDNTRRKIREVYNKCGYILDPHGAVGYCAIVDEPLQSDGYAARVVLHTAHPLKFSGSVEPEIGCPVPVPAHLTQYVDNENRYKIAIDGDNQEMFAEQIKRVI